MSGKGERLVVVSALTVLVIYAYRRATETPAAPSNLVGALVGSKAGPAPLGQFITAWGFAFFAISLVAEFSPGFGGSFALLVAVSDVLANGQPLFADITKAVTGPKNSKGSKPPPSSSTPH